MWNSGYDQNNWGYSNNNSGCCCGKCCKKEEKKHAKSSAYEVVKPREISYITGENIICIEKNVHYAQIYSINWYYIKNGNFLNEV